MTIRQMPDRVAVDVHSTGNRSDGPVDPGQGLRGMAERVALYEGALETIAEAGGFRVTATFPVAAQ